MRTIIALLFLGLFVVGCGASTDTAPADGADDEPTIREVLEESGVQIDPDLRDFMLLEEKRAGQEYYVAYTFSGTGEAAKFESQTAIYHSKDRVRTDTIVPGVVEGRSYELGDRYISCSRMSTTWTCDERDLSGVEIDYGSESEDDIEVYDSEELELGSEIERDGTETILGQEADCWKITTDEFVGRECRNNKGVMLLTTGTHSDGSTVEIRATDYQGSVSSSDFEPPAEPMDPDSPEAQEASCRQGCAYLEMTDSECDELCANAGQPPSFEDYEWE